MTFRGGPESGFRGSGYGNPQSWNIAIRKRREREQAKEREEQQPKEPSQVDKNIQTQPVVGEIVKPPSD